MVDNTVLLVSGISAMLLLLIVLLWMAGRQTQILAESQQAPAVVTPPSQPPVTPIVQQPPAVPIQPIVSPIISRLPTAGIGTIQLIERPVAAAPEIQSPSPSADLQTVLGYILRRGSTLDNQPLSPDMETALKSPTSWQVRGGNPPSYYYPKGINTQSSYLAYYDNSSSKWNIRADQ
jgi:hypothetical protein